MNNEQFPIHGNNEPEHEVFGTSRSARLEMEAAVRGYLTMSGDDEFEVETLEFRKRLSDFVGSGLDSNLRRHLKFKNAEGTYEGLIKEETPTENTRLFVYYLFMANNIGFYKDPYIDELAKALKILPFGDEGRWAVEDYVAEHDLIPLAELLERNNTRND